MDFMNQTMIEQFLNSPNLVMQWLKSPGGRKVLIEDRQIIKSSCTKYKKIFGTDVSMIKFDD